MGSSLRSESWNFHDSHVLGTFVGAEHSSMTSQEVKVTQTNESRSLGAHDHFLTLTVLTLECLSPGQITAVLRFFLDFVLFCFIF